MTPPTHSPWVYLRLRAGVFYLPFQNMIFHTFQQLAPKQVGEEWIANLVRRYDVEAHSPEHAIAQAKEWDLFRRGKGMGRSPIVQEAT